MKIAVWLTHQDIACWRFSDAHRDKLAAALPGVDVAVCADPEAFVAALADARVALVWGFRQEWLAHAPELEWIVTPAAGRDYFDIEPRAGLTVENSSFHGQLMAETVVGMMLAQCRGLVRAHAMQPTDPWPRARIAPHMRTLRGAHVVVLGFGHIGEWIAQLAKPLGARITGIRRHAQPAPAYFGPADRVRTQEALDEVLPAADHLALALPRAPETDHILSARRIGLLPRHAYVYNVGRGNAIDEAALAEALNRGRLAGACLDVFEQEPLPEDAPIRTAANALLLPHASAIAPQYLDLFLDEFIDKFRRRYGAPAEA